MGMCLMGFLWDKTMERGLESLRGKNEDTVGERGGTEIIRRRYLSLPLGHVLK